VRTQIPQPLKADSGVQIAESALRSCVHCGFCNATCPTYLLSGNELEGPRGRIYLIKNALEGSSEVNAATVAHIDHCLGCLACETTCPSGVTYSHLLEEARPRLEKQIRRPWAEKALRWLLIQSLPYPGRLRLALRMAPLGRRFGFLLPSFMRPLIEMAPRRLPAKATVARSGIIPAQGKRRLRVALLTGCAQQVLGPQINDASVRLLGRLGCEVVVPPAQGCCGALTFHMGERQRSLALMRHNIAVWHDEMEKGGLDAIVLNTSGCGTAVKEYGHIFRDEPAWAAKAAAVAAKVRDISEVVADLGIEATGRTPALKVAYHDACSLQHGQRVKHQPRQLLADAGFEVVEVPEGHICCGSAGTYNMLYPETAAQLRQRKAAHIESMAPQVVCAGNIGCIEQIAAGVGVPVVHTVELLDWATGGPAPAGLAEVGLADTRR
jgi:glycolate oxidase iron-sulfur subunit